MFGCILFINISSYKLVVVLVSINLVYDEEGVCFFFFCCFGNGVVNIWLVMEEIIDRYGVIRL